MIAGGGRLVEGATRAWRAILANAAALLALGGLVIVALGIFVAGISPLTVLRKAAADYEDYEARRALVEDHVALGNKLLDVEQPAAARVQFQAALALDETDTEATLGLVKTRVFEPIAGDELDPEVSHKRLTHLVLTRPDDPHARAYRGDSWLRFGMFHMALSEYARSVRLNSKLAHGYSGLGIVYDVLGEPAKALERYERALEISGHSTRYRSNYASQLARLGRRREAIEHYERLLTVDPGALLPYYGLAHVNRLRGDWTRAREAQLALVSLIVDRRLRGLPRNRGVWYFHTLPVHTESLPEGSDPPLAQLVNTEQKELYARLGLALTEAAVGDRAAALRQLRHARALDLDPTKVLAPLTVACFDVDQLRRAQARLADRLDAFVASLERELGRPDACD